MSQYPHNQSPQQPTPPPGQYPYYPQQPMQEQSPFQQYPQQPPPGFQFPPPGSYRPPQQPLPKRKNRKGLWIALTPAQIEAAYKLITTDTTVTGLDKDGNAGQGKDVHFTCSISGFVKDSSGNTAGANVTDVNASGSVIQVAFTPGTDVTQMNENDLLEVWGADQGTSSGSNAFGATVQKVVVQAQYMKDQTTGYRADS